MNQTTPQVSNLALTRIENTPALLLENAFISSPTDYEMMIQSEYQQRFGEAVGGQAKLAVIRASHNYSCAAVFQISFGVIGNHQIETRCSAIFK